MIEFVMRHTVLLMLAALVLVLSACAVHYTLHPGAFNQTDSTAYDALLVAESVIDQARQDYTSGLLPDRTKDLLNALIMAYNVTRDSWLTYRGVIGTSIPADTYLDQLTKNLSDLAAAVRAFEIASGQPAAQEAR